VSCCIDTGPPERKKARRESRPERARRLRKPTRYYLHRQAFATRLYISILAERRANNLLAPFHCSGCGQASLDPVGWNGPHTPLCEICVDAEGMGL
jgi:hypothetical protein